MNVGIKLDGIPAECLLDLAPQIERAGFDELWVVEDYGLAGGFVQAATALARTRSIRVGLGIAPAAVRNVMYLSMEIASLARMHPDRFIAGIGHGMPEWLHQVGAHPESLMTTLEEVATAARGILHGETVTFHGRHVNLDDARLTHPPTPPPPLNLGVRGPKGLRLASRIADGTILAEGSGPQYVADVRHLAGPSNHRITVFSWLSINYDGELARERLRPTIATALTQPFMTAQLGPLISATPDDSTIGALAVVGTPSECADRLRRLYQAGADAVILQPLPGHEAAQMSMLASDVLPLMH